MEDLLRQAELCVGEVSGSESEEESPDVDAAGCEADSEESRPLILLGVADLLEGSVQHALGTGAEEVSPSRYVPCMGTP